VDYGKSVVSKAIESHEELLRVEFLGCAIYLGVLFNLGVYELSFKRGPVIVHITIFKFQFSNYPVQYVVLERWYVQYSSKVTALLYQDHHINVRDKHESTVFLISKRLNTSYFTTVLFAAETDLQKQKHSSELFVQLLKTMPSSSSHHGNMVGSSSTSSSSRSNNNNNNNSNNGTNAISSNDDSSSANNVQMHLQSAANSQVRLGQLFDENDHKRCSEGNRKALLAENLDQLRGLVKVLETDDWKYSSNSAAGSASTSSAGGGSSSSGAAAACSNTA
jgi:hypothetical protein